MAVNTRHFAQYKDYCKQAKTIEELIDGTSQQNTGRDQALSEDYQQ